jgi:glycolate oxidase FAD binding subunit
VTEILDTEDAVASVIREASASGTPLELTAGGTRRGLGRPVQAARTVSLAGLTGVTLYEPGEQTLVVQAGATIASIREMLDGENQQLGFEPPDHRALLGSSGEPTIGGAVAVAASGPRRLRAGAVRDALLGIRFVSGTGEVLSSGGRVMKNVTGYDLAKLQCGAYGTLGAITEIGLRVVPKIEVEKTLAIAGLSDAEAVAALAAAMKTPTDITAAAHLPAWAAKELGFGDAMPLLRVEGFETQAAYRIARLKDALAGHEVGEIDSDPWPAIRDAMMFAGDDRAVWRLSVKPTDAPGIVAAVTDQMECEAFYDWAGGLVWLACDATSDAHHAAIRAAIAPGGGHATLIRASDTTRAAVPVFQPEAAPIAALTRRIKDTFNPKGVLNPGRMRG